VRGFLGLRCRSSRKIFSASVAWPVLSNAAPRDSLTG
jgi:hypothetical protein